MVITVFNGAYHFNSAVMGCILNRFDKLMELKEKPDSTKRFKLTAVIVNDPKDKDLYAHIQKYFLKFAQYTGKNFLFITFIQPSKEYADALKKGEFENAKYLLSEDSVAGGVDRKIDPLLREYYDLPNEGSYMVIVKNLTDNILYKVPITKDSLPYQFMLLNSYCDAPKDFNKLLADLNAEAYSVKDELLNSLLKIVSLVSPAGAPSDYRLGYYVQIDTALKTIKEEKQKLRAILKCSNEDLTERILDIYDIIDNTYTTVLNEGKKVEPTVKCNHFKELESHSRKYWNTYYRLSTIDAGEKMSDLDYSAFVLYFGKIVENELNLSVCQMIRNAMGIDMPLFYNRFCKYKSSRLCIPTEKMNILINKFRKDGEKKVLESVPMGNLRHAYLTTIGKEQSMDYNWGVNYPENLIRLPDSFLVFWEKFAETRNNAAHTGETDLKTYSSAKESFNTFLNEYMEVLYKLKSKLRPNKFH